MKRLPVWRRPYFSGRILDIGAGHNPFQGVTHVIDVTALPFQSGSFDYIYASHVLEHVELPGAACREIMRVGRAGYIETPSPFLEQGLALRGLEPPENWFHKWFVFSLAADLLVFEPKTPETVSQFCSCADGRFMRDFYEAVEFVESQHCFRRKAKTTIYYWKSSFQVEVRNRTKTALLANCNDLLRALRLLRFRRAFPGCKGVFRKYGHRTVFVS